MFIEHLIGASIVLVNGYMLVTYNIYGSGFMTLIVLNLGIPAINTMTTICIR